MTFSLGKEGVGRRVVMETSLVFNITAWLGKYIIYKPNLSCSNTLPNKLIIIINNTHFIIMKNSIK